MIPKNGWKDLDCAPRDGTAIMVKSREYNHPGADFQVNAAQWLCDPKGKDWRWRKPGCMGTIVFADEWMTFEQFQQAQADEEQPSLTFPNADTVEFDL